MRNSAANVVGTSEQESGTAAPANDIQRLTALGMRLRSEYKHREAAQALGRVAELLPHHWLAHYNAGALYLEAQQPQEAAGAFERAVTLKPSAPNYVMCGHALALCGAMSDAKRAYERALTFTPNDYDANWGLFEVEQVLGETESALRHQRIALSVRSLRSIEALVTPAQTTVLELCIAGSFQANIPLDFLLDRKRTTVHKLYLGEHPIPPLPHYDIVFNTIADAPNAGAALAAAAAFIAGQDHPALNAPHLVPLTSRDAVAARFARSATVAVARTAQIHRSDVAGVQGPYPFLIRPLDSHAGNDLAKIDDARALEAYLAETAHADDFYLSAFIDYRNVDGYYRKYRIVFVDGVPYPVHLAISPRWMIHYYNADMAENQWMRDEEHAFMRDMDSVFSGVLAAGLREIAREIPLDYFGIDCSIAPDGRVLLFEASSAMIVHLRDPVDLYPYKAKYVPRVIAALERLFAARLGREARG